MADQWPKDCRDGRREEQVHKRESAFPAFNPLIYKAREKAVSVLRPSLVLLAIAVMCLSLPRFSDCLSYCSAPAFTCTIIDLASHFIGACHFLRP